MPRFFPQKGRKIFRNTKGTWKTKVYFIIFALLFPPKGRKKLQNWTTLSQVCPILSSYENKISDNIFFNTKNVLTDTFFWSTVSIKTMNSRNANSRDVSSIFSTRLMWIGITKGQLIFMDVCESFCRVLYVWCPIFSFLFKTLYKILGTIQIIRNQN